MDFFKKQPKVGRPKGSVSKSTQRKQKRAKNQEQQPEPCQYEQPKTSNCGKTKTNWADPHHEKFPHALVSATDAEGCGRAEALIAGSFVPIDELDLEL